MAAAPLINSSGALVRPETLFRSWIKADGSTDFQPESGRYHLYVAWACPWAHRTIIVRRLKGLESCISMDVVDCHKSPAGWHFQPSLPGSTIDTVNGKQTLREIYELAAGADYAGRVSVPVLWDKKTKTIVNNESSEIIRMLNSEFSQFCATDEQRKLDLYPTSTQASIEEVNAWVYHQINNGVYRAGFAHAQEPYDTAVRDVFDGLDKVEAILSSSRYLTGNQLTLADVRLYTTLVRFDKAYYVRFYCNKRRIVDYPNIWSYLKDLFQRPGFGDTTNFEHIEKGYFGSKKTVKPVEIIPIGPDLDFTASHDRNKFSAQA